MDEMSVWDSFRGSYFLPLQYMMLDVNMAIIWSKVTKEHVFKNKEPIKKKSITDWEKELSRLFKRCK
jgi:hypothetical protein